MNFVSTEPQRAKQFLELICIPNKCLKEINMIKSPFTRAAQQNFITVTTDNLNKSLWEYLKKTYNALVKNIILKWRNRVFSQMIDLRIMKMLIFPKSDYHSSGFFKWKVVQTLF